MNASAAHLKKWTPAVARKTPDNIVSSDYATAKVFLPSYEKERRPDIERLLSNHYQRVWWQEKQLWDKTYANETKDKRILPRMLIKRKVPKCVTVSYSTKRERSTGKKKEKMQRANEGLDTEKTKLEECDDAKLKKLEDTRSEKCGKTELDKFEEVKSVNSEHDDTELQKRGETGSEHEEAKSEKCGKTELDKFEEMKNEKVKLEERDDTKLKKLEDTRSEKCGETELDKFEEVKSVNNEHDDAELQKREETRSEHEEARSVKPEATESEKYDCDEIKSENHEDTETKSEKFEKTK